MSRRWRHYRTIVETSADVCDTCDEAFIDGDVSEDVYEQAEVTVGAVLAVVTLLAIHLVE
jgi:hypothetical protein